jgi:hypothetical protein
LHAVKTTLDGLHHGMDVDRPYQISNESRLERKDHTRSDSSRSGPPGGRPEFAQFIRIDDNPSRSFRCAPDFLQHLPAEHAFMSVILEQQLA